MTAVGQATSIPRGWWASQPRSPEAGSGNGHQHQQGRWKAWLASVHPFKPGLDSSVPAYTLAFPSSPWNSLQVLGMNS